MATRTLAANKSSLFADSGGSELGGGNDDHLPVGGPWGSYTFRSAVRFALDWSGVKSITSAVLRVRTSSQVHIGFSTDPDIQVSRCTGDWTANSGKSSADSGGGPGWSTSPTVWPGPAMTSTGRVSKDIPTSEGTWVDIDITAIVKAWAPATIPGGGGAANYGVMLHYAASGDVTEFSSSKSVYSPEIVLTYATDSPPPAPTVTAPTGTGSNLRPLLSATAVDPDGDPLEVGDVEVRKAGAVVYSSVAFAASGATTLDHTPASDLPSGDLTVRFRARAAGVYGAWSAEAPFAIDRAPTTNAPTAPAGNISGNRRPNIVFTAADLDADPLELFDVEVYATSSGAPTGSPVYAVTSGTTGIAGYTVTHTPTADLPVGPLMVRARVRARGVYSAWSGYTAFTIVTANPSVSIVWPPTPGGPLLFFTPHPAPGTGFPFAAVSRFQAECIAPAGFTFTTIRRKLVRLDGPNAPFTIMDSDLGGVAGSTTFFVSQPVTVKDFAAGGTWAGMSALLEVTITATASNGGQTVAVRRARYSFLEWQGAVYLGDNVTALAVSDVTPPAGDNAAPLDRPSVWYRAQASKTAPNGAATWRDASGLATVRSELPAQNAYLGVYVRSSRQADDVDVLGGIGMFEDAALPGWATSGLVASVSPGLKYEGIRCLQIRGDGVTGYPQASVMVPAVPGGAYTLSGALLWAAGTGEIDVRVDAHYIDGTQVAFVMRLLKTTGAAWELLSSGPWVCPAGVKSLQVIAYIAASPSVSGQDCRFDAIQLLGPPSGYGFDRIDVDWTSAG